MLEIADPRSDHDPKFDLDVIAREGARRMLVAALEAEVTDYIDKHQQRDEDGKALVVRNGKANTRRAQSRGRGPTPPLRSRRGEARTGSGRQGSNAPVAQIGAGWRRVPVARWCTRTPRQGSSMATDDGGSGPGLAFCKAAFAGLEGFRRPQSSCAPRAFDRRVSDACQVRAVGGQFRHDGGAEFRTDHQGSEAVRRPPLHPRDADSRCRCAGPSRCRPDLRTGPGRVARPRSRGHHRCPRVRGVAARPPNARGLNRCSSGSTRSSRRRWRRG